MIMDLTKELEVPFTPAPWLPGPHWMTVYGSVARLPPIVRFRRERWELPDGDFVDVDRLPAATVDAPLVVICHGLEGSSRSGYVLGLARELSSRGWACWRSTFAAARGAQPPAALLSFGRDRRPASRDGASRRRAPRPRPWSGRLLPGGNVVCKLLAEGQLPDEVRAAAVVSVPFDLGLCCRAIDGEGFFLGVPRTVSAAAREKALKKAQRFPRELDAAAVRRARSLRGFDDAVTAPLHGFTDAMDYYTRCSSGPLLGRVDRPLHILHAEDDPLIPPEAIPPEP